jgi:signal transduction histidine kinase
MLKDNCRDGNVKIYLEMPEIPVVVVMQEEYLADVLFEILQNAVEASPQDGIIKIALVASEEVLAIEVYDQGDGIPAELCPYIFEPFFTTKNGSMGLGLPVSKNMVESMGGSIDFESQKGHETVFRVILPFGIAVGRIMRQGGFAR